MSLYYVFGRYDGFDMRGVIGYGIFKVFKCFLVLINLKLIKLWVVIIKKILVLIIKDILVIV